MKKEKSPELLEFEKQTTSMVKNSRHYVDDAASLQRRINSLRLDIESKREILKQFESELQRKLQQSQTKLF